MEKAGLVRVDTAVQHEHVGRLDGCADRESLGSFDFIGAVEELGAALAVKPFTEFVGLAEVARGDVALYETHVALGLAAFLQPREVRVDVGLTTLATERALFHEVDDWHLARSLSVVVLRWLGQRLEHEPELNSTLKLHLLVLRRGHCR